VSQETQHIADTFTLEHYQQAYQEAVKLGRPSQAKANLRLAKIAGYTESQVKNEQKT